MSQQTSTSETIVALYLALKERDSCESCGGSGTNWVCTGGTAYADLPEVDAEPCECAEIAECVLEKYKGKFEANAVVYLATQGIPSDGNIQPEILMNELFKDVR